MCRRSISWLFALPIFLLPANVLAQVPEMPGVPGQRGDEEVPFAAIALLLFVAVVSFVVALVVMGIVGYLVYLCLDRIPLEYRQVEPWKAFLTLIPCFNLVWNFILFRGLARSYQSYFQAAGRTDLGDCGEKLGLWYSIAVACCLVPILNYVAGIAALVLLIILLIKAFELRRQIPELALKAAAP